MKKIFRVLWLPFLWLWRFVRTGITVLANILFLGVLSLFLVGLFHTPKIEIAANSALLINPKGKIVEERSAMYPFNQLIENLAGVPLEEEVFLQDLIDAIRHAAKDTRIKLLLLDLDQLGAANLDQLAAIGAALEGFKAQGKQIIAQGDSFNQIQYYLASWADSVYLNPMGSVQVQGFSVFRLYIKELLDKLAINVNIFRVGVFKSALEPIMRNDMSEADRASTSLWLNNLWNLYSADIAKHRKITPEAFQSTVVNVRANLLAAGGDRARMAQNTGLVDGVKTAADMEALLRPIVGPGQNNQGINHVRLNKYLRTLTSSYDEKKDASGNMIGIIYAAGDIVYGDGSPGQIGSHSLIKQIRKARRDGRIKALVLRINTGGGSAVASEAIRQELLLVKKEGKAVVISMGAMAASGGYWLAADADKIIAAPSTLTGSIGIFGAVPTFEQTLAKAGIYSDGVVVGRSSYFSNLARPMHPDEAAIFQLDVEHGYQRFLELVANGRKKSVVEVEKIAEGRVWDGVTALKLGLVDGLGGLEEALTEASKLSKIPKNQVMYIQRSPNSMLERFGQMQQPSALWIKLLQPFGLAPWVADGVRRQWDFILSKTDPSSLYAHSLLPSAEDMLH